VIDYGIGIKPEDIDKLFKLFGFLDSSIELNTKGIGLGLYICKRMVEIFGGKMEVKSEVDVGTTFTYEFQLSEGQIGEKSSVKRLTNPEKLGDRMMTVIVVKDMSEYPDTERLSSIRSLCNLRESPAFALRSSNQIPEISLSFSQIV
jgi:hypothetical protein